jgi:hypothetical protein
MISQKKAIKLKKKVTKVRKDDKTFKFENKEKKLLDDFVCPYCKVKYWHKKTVWNHIRQHHPHVDQGNSLKGIDYKFM